MQSNKGVSRTIIDKSEKLVAYSCALDTDRR